MNIWEAAERGYRQSKKYNKLKIKKQRRTIEKREAEKEINLFKQF